MALQINVDSVNILKSCGGSSKESMLVKVRSAVTVRVCLLSKCFRQGYALNCTRASPAMPLLVKDARIACIDFSLRKEKMSMGYQVVVQDTSKLEAIRDRESDLVAEKIKLILAAGANVVFSTKAKERGPCLLFAEVFFWLSGH